MAADLLEISKADQALIDAMRNEEPLPETEEVASDPSASEQSAQVESPLSREGPNNSEAAATPQPKPRAPDGKFVKPEEPGKKTVPLEALHEAREEAKRLRDEFNQYKGTTETRMRQLTERFTAPQEKPAPEPTLEQDPIAVVRQQGETIRQLQTREQARDMESRFVAQINGAVEQFKQQTPDYNDAYSYARQHRAAELKAMGYADERIPQQILADEASIGYQALQAGRNPGEVIYSIAKARGYQGRAAPVVEQQTAPIQNGRQRLETIDRGQQAAQSLGSGGTAVETELTLEKVLEKPDLIGSLSDAEWRRIMGG